MISQVDRKQAGKHVLLNYTAPACLRGNAPASMRLTAALIGGGDASSGPPSFLGDMATALTTGVSFRTLFIRIVAQAGHLW